ncbi:hypothetical protein ArV2_gp25 [Arthrobacter phage vB_ArS-ArV2]|uniref:Uncharacterized protein n=1 Tax=Arthrobacter phage vB_ArS-ArV2 TaxID=1414742 RepID=V5R8R5_9CAUD|nr:hypothetical protein ArV2_gp25 [Arthrobacter phage vB_ArS-ArV2]AHB31636.1 hypothetical protein ArV2_gp25 [Arthrobacter phage vB_ArS-ArV2]
MFAGERPAAQYPAALMAVNASSTPKTALNSAVASPQLSAGIMAIVTKAPTKAAHFSTRRLVFPPEVMP